MKIDPQAPAFPAPNDANVNGQPGLTVRAYFAGLAMQGLCANPALQQIDARSAATHVSVSAVRMADALIAALNGETVEREPRDGDIIGWSVRFNIRDLSNNDLRAAFMAARNFDLSKP